MKNYSYYLFDWNGTLLDDLNINIEIENLLLRRRGLSELPSKEYYLSNFGFPIIDFYTAIGFDFKKESYKDVASEYAKEYEKRISVAPLFEDVIPVLEELKNKGKKLVIISATEHKLLNSQVKNYGIENYFSSVLGIENNLGKSKVERALQWLSDENASPEDTLFIGDTVHDYETAKAIGCDCVLIPRGHNSEKRLKETASQVKSSLKEIL